MSDIEIFASVIGVQLVIIMNMFCIRFLITSFGETFIDTFHCFKLIAQWFAVALIIVIVDIVTICILLDAINSFM